ncbi:30S ribosomal protein S17 [Candidatus Microgenomates bacterium]|nr:30S ribosomal protein S17 [Candidatus Microgenomates bacterium]
MKTLKGKVVSTKMKKTATVAVERTVSHKMYIKRFKKTKKYQVHTENEVKVGDTVSFVACRPISKSKRHKLLEKETKKK